MCGLVLAGQAFSSLSFLFFSFTVIVATSLLIMHAICIAKTTPLRPYILDILVEYFKKERKEYLLEERNICIPKETKRRERKFHNDIGLGI